MDYLDYLEMTSKSKATQDDADKLADELNENWWQKNRKRFTIVVRHRNIYSGKHYTAEKTLR